MDGNYPHRQFGVWSRKLFECATRLHGTTRRGATRLHGLRCGNSLTAGCQVAQSRAGQDHGSVVGWDVKSGRAFAFSLILNPAVRVALSPAAPMMFNRG